MGLSQEMAFQPVAKKSLPPKPKKVQADMRLEPSMDIWQERALADFLDTPDMEQPDFAWPTNLEEESHPNQVSLQEEVSWNNNPQMLDQLFHGSLLEEEQQPQVEEMQLVEQVGEQVGEVHQLPKQEVEEMRWISPAEAEGIVQPKKEVEEIYTFGVDDQNNLELLNPEQQDTLQNALQETGIDLNAFSMEDTFTFGDGESFVPSTSASATTESFIDSTPATASSATIEDLLNVGAAQDDDPDWMPEEELLRPSTSRARRPSCARKPAIRSVQKTSMKKKPGRPEREGPYHIPAIPTRNARIGMSEEELQGLKYRRMRELNNQASKACRAKRKNKQQAMEEELVVEQEKNLRLRHQLEVMEEKCAKLKELTSPYYTL